MNARLLFLAATFTTLATTGLATTALAGECDRWTAGMQEDEGGPVMTASICLGSGDAQSVLIVQCSGKAGFSYRYIPTGWSVPESDSYQTRLTVKAGATSVEKEAQYESMDGALAFGVDAGEALVEAMKSEKEITFTDIGGKLVAPTTFTLKGSSKAFDKMKAVCTD